MFLPVDFRHRTERYISSLRVVRGYQRAIQGSLRYRAHISTPLDVILRGVQFSVRPLTKIRHGLRSTHAGILFYAEEHDSQEMTIFNKIIETYAADEERARSTMSLKNVLQRQNDSKNERMIMDLYLVTNPSGAGDCYVGAASTVSWW